MSRSIRILGVLVAIVSGGTLRAAESEPCPPSVFQNLTNLFEPQRDPRLWVNTEYLLWWFKESPVPVPLVTSGSPSNAIPGALGASGTHVLLGEQTVTSQPHSGGRFSAGYWLNEDATLGVDASYLFVAPRPTTQFVSTSGLPGSQTLAVPIFDPSGATGPKGGPGETVFILPTPFGNSPGFQGRFQLDLTSRLQGAEANASSMLFGYDNIRYDGLVGFRWLQLNETLNFSGQTSGAPGSAFVGQFYNFNDQFATQNNFYGGQLGTRVVYQSGPFRFLAFGKVAFGDVHETTIVSGSSQTSNSNLFFKTAGTAGQVIPGGVFAQPSNLGSHSTDNFAVVPEVNARVAYRLRSNLEVSFGYSFLYVTGLARPGDEMEHAVNTTPTSLADASRATGGTAPAAAGPNDPGFPFQNGKFWAQGVNLGLVLDF